MNGFERELAAFADSEWGQATTAPTGAAGLCKRATLVLPARLEAAGLVDDVELWTLNGPVAGKGRGQSGTHWVLVRDGEVIDVSARQFDPGSDHIRRALRQDEFERWHEQQRIDPDGEHARGEGFLRVLEIPPHWRDLLTVAPPGDLPGWPYPRQNHDETSPWHAPETT